MNAENGTGFEGQVDGIPYYAVDEQIFEFKNIALIEDLTPAGFLGYFADEAGLRSAHPTGLEGDSAVVIDTNTIWFWDINAGPADWVDTTIAPGGDMSSTIYDPTNIADDVFDMDNMVESDTKKVYTSTERNKLDTIEEGAEKNKAGNLILGANEALFPSTNPATASSRNGHPILNFINTIAENIIFASKVQTKYQGDDITIDIDWIAETATSGGVTFGVEFERNAVGGNDIDSDSFATQQTGNSTTNATSGIITRTSITLTQAQADGVTASDYFRIRIQRVVGDGGDTMLGNAQILRAVVRM